MDLEEVLKPEDIEIVRIDAALLAKAAVLAEKFPVNHKSYMKGGRHLVGAVGELLILERFSASAEDGFDSDVLICNKKFDVKAKQRRWTSRENILTFAENGFEGSVQAESADIILNKEVDGYIFVSMKEDFSFAHLIGFIYKDEFLKHARKIVPNTLDITNGIVSTAFNYNIYYKNLYPLKCLKN